MQKETWTWASVRLAGPARVARWGHFGTPVLLFPSAGGDYEEVERFHLVRALSPLIGAGRIKVFSVDGVAAQTWLRGTGSPVDCARVQSSYDAYIDEEVVPFIRRDLLSDTVEIVAAGAAIGACSAVSTLCRRPEIFRAALTLSGIFDLSRYLQGGFSPELSGVLPLHEIPALEEGPRLQKLRRRFVRMASGEGSYEDPAQSRRLAAALAARGIPHQLDLWGPGFAHSWGSWQEMLPRALAPHL
jgi:esterase/lipase superfamily enzyme